MNLRKSLFAALCVATLSAAYIPVSTGAPARVYLDVAPPEPRVEVAPAPRRGYVWAPGYWNARGHRHVWTRGHWVRERHGFRYNEPRWSQRSNRWYLERGHWERGG